MKFLGCTSVSNALYQRSGWLKEIKYSEKLFTLKVILTTAQKTFVLCHWPRFCFFVFTATAMLKTDSNHKALIYNKNQV